MERVLKGYPCFKGERGYSAYEIAVQNGFKGTEEEWLEQIGFEEINAKLPANVKNFGAVGDGVTDDTVAIQTALETGGNIHFPSGTYLITSSITISNGCILSGEGESTIIKSEADICFITNASNITIENMKMVGNDTNTAISVFKNKQIIRNIVFEHFKIGCINKNTDYIGTVKFVDLSFDYVSICFQSTTLTNGVTFERIVAYRFDRILNAYWIESVAFNNCFFEIGNEGSVVLDIPEEKTNCRAMGLSFNSCYIENVTQLLGSTITGVIKFDSCWLYTTDTLYNATEYTNNLKLLFTNCAFSISSSLTTSTAIFKFSNTHIAVFNNSYGLKSGTGTFTVKKGTNVIGDNVIMDNQIIKQTTVTKTTDENGIIQPGQLTTEHRILCVCGFRTDGGSNMYAIPYMSGNNWYVTCRNPLNDSLLANTEMKLRITYIDSVYLEVI